MKNPEEGSKILSEADDNQNSKSGCPRLTFGHPHFITIYHMYCDISRQKTENDNLKKLYM